MKEVEENLKEMFGSNVVEKLKAGEEFYQIGTNFQLQVRPLRTKADIIQEIKMLCDRYSTPFYHNRENIIKAIKNLAALL